MFEFKFNRIPTINDDDLNRLAAVIKPLRYTIDDLREYDLSPQLLAGQNFAYRETAFTWVGTKKPALNYNRECATVTYHKFGAPALFKPSVAEVVAQVRAQLPPEQFRFVMGFSCDTNLNGNNCLGEGYHFTKTALYSACICHDGPYLESNESVEDVLAGGGAGSGTVVGYHTHDGPVPILNYQVVRPGDVLMCRRQFSCENSAFKEGCMYVANSTPFLKNPASHIRAVRFKNGAVENLERFEVVK